MSALNEPVTTTKAPEKTTEAVEAVEQAPVLKEFDPFEYLTVTFEGTAPYAKLQMKNTTSGAPTALKFTADKEEGLRNGDVVTVTADNAEKDGCKPTKTENTYTVEGLSSYLENLDQLPQDTSDKILKQCEDDYTAYTAGKWDPERQKINKLECIGNYLLTPKEGISTDSSTLIYVFKINAFSLSDDGSEDFDYYWTARTNSISFLPDGTCSVELSNLNYYDYKFSRGLYKAHYNEYVGYKDFDTMFSKEITANIGKYEYVSTVEEK